MNRALIAPLVALFCLLVKQVFNVQIDNLMMDTLTDSLLAIITMAGLFMNPKAEVSDDDEMDS